MLKIKILILLLFTLTAIRPESYAQCFFNINSVKKEMQPLSFPSQVANSEEILKYFDCYGLNYKKQKHTFGWFISDDYKLASHIIIPEKPKGTVIIFHGYFDHTGHIKPLIDLCLKLNYTVAAIDLPGHGLSGGEPGAINDFNEYARLIDTFLEKFKKTLPAPIHLIGHSTGCSGIYEYLNYKTVNPVKSVILLAPLVRSNHWFLSKTAFLAVRHFLQNIPRRYTKSSGNEKFLEWLKNDPLEGRYISTKWFNALYSWNKTLHHMKQIKTPVLIVQGDKDTTVDWEYNLTFLKDKMPNHIVKMINGGRHHLPNEEVELQSETFRYIEDFLTGD